MVSVVPPAPYTLTLYSEADVVRIEIDYIVGTGSIDKYVALQTERSHRL